MQKEKHTTKTNQIIEKIKCYTFSHKSNRNAVFELRKDLNWD